uniref:Adenosine 3'-phospho 5'-phosphosulfate transporter 2 n=1 Tax=Glossina brevipalpis TaxID=37001 RepID=A0A1A9WBU8_9MUSC
MTELIFTRSGLESISWFLTLIQFGYYTCFGLLEIILNVLRNGVTAWIRKIPLRTHMILAGLTLGTIAFSNSSLRYLNFPTQVIFKSCKLIPVMLGSILIQRKPYGILDFLAAITMCIGLIWFILVDSHLSPNFNIIGVMYISLTLLCDAIIGNVQEKTMNDYKAPSHEIIFYSYGLGFIYLLIVLLITDNFFNGLTLSLQNPHECFGCNFLFSLSGFLGVHFILALVRNTGASVAVTVTTVRKAITMIISFFFFSKPFTMQYIWSGLLVVIGIYLNVFSKKYKVIVSDMQQKIQRRLFTTKFYIKTSDRSQNEGTYRCEIATLHTGNLENGRIVSFENYILRLELKKKYDFNKYAFKISILPKHYFTSNLENVNHKVVQVSHRAAKIYEDISDLFKCNSNRTTLAEVYSKRNVLKEAFFICFPQSENQLVSTDPKQRKAGTTLTATGCLYPVSQVVYGV